MTMSVHVILIALFSISATVALILAAAWHDLGRPAHARTWSFAFALTACVPAMALASAPDASLPPLALVYRPVIGGVASAIIMMGFRQRAGLPDRRWTLLGLAAAFAAIMVTVVHVSTSRAAWVAPLCAWNAVMFTLAARTLRGRRRGERGAERLAEAGLGLLALLHFLVLGGMIGSAAGLLMIKLDRLGDVVMLTLPTIMGGIGLFTIILLTADLADRTRRLAATDMLTGLLNRRGFDAAARTLFAAARRSRRPMALVIIDVDRFKQINDRFGHPAGDRVLRALCARIKHAIGRRDVFARVGGEEFALILTDVDLPAATCAVEVLRLQVATMAVVLPEPHQVTASFGIAAPGGPDDDFDKLFHRADQALYRSKQEGRNRVTVAEPTAA